MSYSWRSLKEGSVKMSRYSLNPDKEGYEIDGNYDALEQQDEDGLDYDDGLYVVRSFREDDGCNESQPTQNGSPDPADWDDDDNDL